MSEFDQKPPVASARTASGIPGGSALHVLMAAGLVIAIGIALVAGQMIRNNFDRIETEWTNFQKNAYEVGRLQHQLQGAFGYGGYIHKFKNYVLRGEEKLAFAAEAEHARINAIIDIYMNKVKSDEERMALDVVRATFDEYSANLQVAQRMVANGAGPIEIDLVVRVDDGPALAARFRTSTWIGPS